MKQVDVLPDVALLEFFDFNVNKRPLMYVAWHNDEELGRTNVES